MTTERVSLKVPPSDQIDPCPDCRGPVTEIAVEYFYVVSNPDAVIATPNPDCPALSDPDADCICPPAMINPAPNPLRERRKLLPDQNDWTLSPCGHRFKQYELAETGWGGWTTHEGQRVRVTLS